MKKSVKIIICAAVIVALAVAALLIFNPFGSKDEPAAPVNTPNTAPVIKGVQDTTV